MAGLEEHRDPLEGLAALARSGDQAALRELLLGLRKPVWRWVARVLTMGRPQEVEELVQEALLQIWRRLDAYDTGRPFRPWAARVTRNLVVDRVRTGRAAAEARELTLDDAPLSATRVAPGDAQWDLSRQLARAVQTLPEQQRTAFLLRDSEGWDYAEIADTLEVSESTVRNHVMIARRKLREHLSGKGETA